MSKSLAKIEKLNEIAQKVSAKMQGLQNELEAAKAENLDLVNKLKQAEQDLAEEKNRYKILSMSKSFGSENEKSAARGKVNEFIREIDKCIALLNK
jgi:multidrug efflux pump subunit AcrA (membrane-fusion protein)